MMIGVIAEHVSGRTLRLDQVGVPFCHLSHNKKCRFHIILFQYLQQSGRILRMGAVVEGQRHRLDRGIAAHQLAIYQPLAYLSLVLRLQLAGRLVYLLQCPRPEPVDPFRFFCRCRLLAACQYQACRSRQPDHHPNTPSHGALSLQRLQKYLIAFLP